MKNETFTIVKKGTDTHFDTNDRRFYAGNWDRTGDTREYLEMLMSNDPEKFEGCEIVDNNL